MEDESDFDVVRAVWAAFNGEDYDAALARIHADVLIVPFGAALEGRSYSGHAGVMDWMLGEIRANWEWFYTEPHEFRRFGERILVYGRWRARGRDSGVELDVAATWVVEVRDGKIAFWRTFTDRDEAHSFVGLQE